MRKICLLTLPSRQSMIRHPDCFVLKRKSFYLTSRFFPDNVSPLQFIPRLFNQLVRNQRTMSDGV